MIARISGRVIKGDGYGRKIGFPTANIDRRHYVRSQNHVRLGVYAGTVELRNGKKYHAGIVIGPLDKRKLPKLEAHLINFRGQLYGKYITLALQKYLRPFRKYGSEAHLKRGIEQDLKIIKRMKYE